MDTTRFASSCTEKLNSCNSGILDSFCHTGIVTAMKIARGTPIRRRTARILLALMVFAQVAMALQACLTPGVALAAAAGAVSGHDDPSIGRDCEQTGASTPNACLMSLTQDSETVGSDYTLPSSPAGVGLRIALPEAAVRITVPEALPPQPPPQIRLCRLLL